MAAIPRKSLFGKLNTLTYKALEGALAYAQLRNNTTVEVSHWIHQIAQAPDSDYKRMLASARLEEGKITQDVIAALNRLPRGTTSITDFSPYVTELVQQAWLYATLSCNETRIRSGHLMLALATTSQLQVVLRDLSPILDQARGQWDQERFKELVAGSPEAEMPSADGLSYQAVPTSEPQATGQATSAESALAKFSVDLTQRARAGEMDPVVGRDAEIRQVVDILMRRRQNNPILTGEPGVGKTALVEGFAIRVASGDVPPPLKNVAVKALDLGLLQAGASVKGEFENRLRQVIDEVQRSLTPIILFIDEAHTLIGAGGTAGQNDAANLLKPALARGTLRTIAATTWSEYKQYFEKDPALTRRFQVVKVGEPDVGRCVLMIRGMVGALEKHHKVPVLDEALQAATHLSHRYIPARQLPDKAVSLLDTACGRVALSQHAVPALLEQTRRRIEALENEMKVLTREESAGASHAARQSEIASLLTSLKEEESALAARFQAQKSLVEEVHSLRTSLTTAKPEEHSSLRSKLSDARRRLTDTQGPEPLVFDQVDSQAVASVVAEWTGIPVGKMVKSEVQGILKLAEALETRVIGQRHALDAIADRVRVAKASLENPTKPVGVFMLAGPSGVGKTETAKALADAIYGGTDALITINMSEFQEPHKVATLMGSPPGYVGYGKGGVLTEAVRRRPYSVVLLDEIEKAHADVHEVFFQVFDKGQMKDSEGLEIDFKNTIILLTTNVGSDLAINMCKDPSLLPTPDALADALRPALRKTFPDALLGRLVVVPYYPISDTMLRTIIGMQLAKVASRLRGTYKASFEYDDAVVSLILDRCREVESGARVVDSLITRTMLPTLSRELLERTMEGNTVERVAVSSDGAEFKYTIT